MKKKEVIITGGAGFIGSRIAKRMVEEGYRVWVIDNLSTGSEASIPAGAEFIKVDISDARSYGKMPREKVDAVLHLAAQSSGEVSDEKPVLDLMSNSLGTLLILSWCIENNVSRFLHASSMGVYGEPKVLPVSEEHICQPISCYGVSKLTAENYIRIFARKGMKFTIFRIFSTYGVGQDFCNLRQGMVSIYMYFLLRNEPIIVKGSLERFRDFIYIDDMVETWVKAINEEKTFGKTYNLGSGRKTTVLELNDEEIRAFGYDPDTYPINCTEPTPNDQFGLFADITRIKTDLNWVPKVSLKEGLLKMVKWAKEKYKL